MDARVSLSFPAFLRCADYSLLRDLTPDPEQARNTPNKAMRQVKSGHYVEVFPTPLAAPRYVIHSERFFRELNLSDTAASEPLFMQFFTGDPTRAAAVSNMGLDRPHLLPRGWATGYALSIYGQELYHHCPFGNGNGYGDGRAISVLEARLPGGERWEFQLKGGGTTPYCRGADGRAVLRSSIREFLASEAMAALGVPTSRALCLFVSNSETITRPWYSPGSRSAEPDRMVNEPAAITTRAAPSFLRVGQLELFGRRARKREHPRALEELEAIFMHTLEREYPEIAARMPWRQVRSVAAGADSFVRLRSTGRLPHPSRPVLPLSSLHLRIRLASRHSPRQRPCPSNLLLTVTQHGPARGRCEQGATAA